MVMVGKEIEENLIKTTTGVTVNWLELPEHITSLILSKLTSITDYARFGAVCTKWLSIFLTDIDEDHCTKSLTRQLPLLMIPTPPSHKKNKKNKNKKKSDSMASCSFYRVTDGKIFNRLQLSIPRDSFVRGSSHGWLITIDADDLFFSIQLINPFFYPNASTKVIKLPPLTAHPFCENPDFLYYCHFRKAVLSANPISNPKDFIVMAIITDFQTLSYCRPGDKTWTPITGRSKGSYHDIIYYQDKLYAVHWKGNIEVFDVVKGTTTALAPCPVIDFLAYKIYLVASGGELFQVHKRVDDRNFDTDGFKVFKLQKREEEVPEWVEVKGLCNRVFFVGDNTSMSISASDFPGCKPNCIYYTDDNIESYFLNPKYGPHDMGVFNLENESFEKHYPTNVNARIWPAPIWIEPVLPRSIARLKRLGKT